MSFTVVIPARYGSARLPGKPLLDIAGKPLLQHVFERAARSAASRVVVATDDERVRAVAERFGAQVVLTAATHLSGTDRVAEVSDGLALREDEVVVNVQGDEALIPPSVIDQVAANLVANPAVDMATLAAPLTAAGQLFDPDIVKVVSDARGLALYFSRAPIPWARADFAAGSPDPATAVSAQRHLGIYAYRVGFLRQFVRWPPAPAEQLECLEQLRALCNGAPVHVAPACAEVPPGVDTAADLALLRRLLAAST